MQDSICKTSFFSSNSLEASKVSNRLREEARYRTARLRRYQKYPLQCQPERQTRLTQTRLWKTTQRSFGPFQYRQIGHQTPQIDCNLGLVQSSDRIIVSLEKLYLSMHQVLTLPRESGYSEEYLL
jgi:DNA polymerase IIIc chi subunit